MIHCLGMILRETRPLGAKRRCSEVSCGWRNLTDLRARGKPVTWGSQIQMYYDRLP